MYWRRRAALLAGIVVVIIVLIMIIKALASGGSDEPKPSPSPSASTSAEASKPAASKIAACTSKQLQGAKLAADADILLTHDKDSYTAAEPVTLAAHVKNTSADDCSILNNPYNVLLHVVSGEDRIFDSSDCASKTAEDAGDAVIVKAGQTADIPITWDATRSQQGCPDTAEKPFRDKDATYVATVKILDVDSDKTQFLLVP